MNCLKILFLISCFICSQRKIEKIEIISIPCLASLDEIVNEKSIVTVEAKKTTTVIDKLFCSRVDEFINKLVNKNPYNINMDARVVLKCYYKKNTVIYILLDSNGNYSINGVVFERNEEFIEFLKLNKISDCDW